MIKLETILGNYKDWENQLEDRFGARLCQFLPNDKLEKIGFETRNPDRKILDWTEENILDQLKKDVKFGWEKACNLRSISASLMVDVCQKWCNVLENGLHYDPDYTDYGKSFLQEIDQKYGWHLTDVDVLEEEYTAKQYITVLAGKK